MSDPVERYKELWKKQDRIGTDLSVPVSIGKEVVRDCNSEQGRIRRENPEIDWNAVDVESQLTR